MLKFLVADDHPLYREAVITALKPSFEQTKFFESDSFDSTFAVLKKQRNIDVLLLDLNMPGCENYYGLLRFRQMFPKLIIVVVSALDDAKTIAETIEFGANGFIPKTLSTLDMVDALNSIMAGATWIPSDMHQAVADVSNETKKISQQVKLLTPKQFQVLRLVKEGMSNKEISEHLTVTEATVKAHISSLFKRLEVKSRTQMLVVIDKLNLD